MDKKAQGLSLNTIIIAIVVLVVLVVVIMIFTGYFGSRFTPSLANCAGQGGRCVEEANCQAAFGGGGNIVQASDCTARGEVCCLQGALNTGGGIRPANVPDEPPE